MLSYNSEVTTHALGVLSSYFGERFDYSNLELSIVNIRFRKHKVKHNEAKHRFLYDYYT